MADSVYFETLRRLYRPIRAAEWTMTLEPMRALLAALGDPQTAFPSVVVAGSTGKGTACAQIAALARAQGRRVGLYTSPHLHLFRERMTTDGVMIAPDEVVSGMAEVFAAAERLGHAYSTFELATALAFGWFARQQIELAVLEVGLGGRFDAVNTVENVLSVFTPIEAEHVAVLGGSLESVAWHKAGILQPGGFGVTVAQTPLVGEVLRREALTLNATLVEAATYWDEPAWSLLADRLRLTRWPDRALIDGVTPPGRLERIEVGGRTVLIDGGHTPLSALRLRAAIDAAGGSARLVIGMLADKDTAGYLSAFDAPGLTLVLTRVPGHRAAEPEALRAAFAPRYAEVEIVADADQALRGLASAPEPLTVVAGSFRLAADAREWFGLLSADEVEEARATRAIFRGM